MPSYRKLMPSLVVRDLQILERQKDYQIILVLKSFPIAVLFCITLNLRRYQAGLTVL